LCPYVGAPCTWSTDLSSGVASPGPTITYGTWMNGAVNSATSTRIVSAIPA
jgi:hypothetical protein